MPPFVVPQNNGDIQLIKKLAPMGIAKLKKFAREQRTRTCSRLYAEKCGKDGPMDCDNCGSRCGSPITPNKPLLGALDTFGRQRLSRHYFMRDFLYSEVAAVHGIANVPDNPRLAIKSGSALCRNLLEPLRQVFGHVTIRSALRSVSVNGFCNCHEMNCSSNKASYANHIWDHLDGDGCMGATACIVIPGFADWVDEGAGRDWRVLAWFIHEYLPYSEMVFFARNGTVNLTWRGDPNDPDLDGDVRRFDGSCDSIVWRSKPRHRGLSFVSPKGLWIKNGEPKEDFGRSQYYKDFLGYLRSTTLHPDIQGYLQQLREGKVNI